MHKDISIVIPVYNGESFVGESVHQIHSYLERTTSYPFEILVVNDGSTDRTAEVLGSLELPHVSIINCPENRGKFESIKLGMKFVKGRCRIFTDADLPYDLEALPYMARLVNDRGFHLVVGDRTLPNSVYAVELSPLRALVTRVFSLFVRLLVVSGLYDTQCGLKAVRGDVADEIFPLIIDRGFAGDVELLYLALKYNLEIKRIPVRLRRNGESSVRVLRHGIKMLGRIIKLRAAWRRGAYQSQGLQTLSAQEYWKPKEVSVSSKYVSSCSEDDGFARGLERE